MSCFLLNCFDFALHSKTRDMLYASILLGSIFDADQVDASENISNNGCRIFFFYFLETVLWSVDETGVSKIYKYTNLMETNEFFTSPISTLPVIIIILTKTFCLYQYSFLFKTQAISSTTFLSSFFTKIRTIFCSKGRPYLMRTFFVSLAGCLKLRNV